MKIFFFCFCLNFLLWFDFLKYFFPLLWCFWLLVLWIYYHHRWLWGNTHHFRQKKQLFSIQNRWVFFFVFVVLNNFLIGRWDVFHLVFSKYEPHAQKIKKNETQNETKTKRGKRRRIKMWRNCSKSVKPAPWISSPVMQSAIQSKIISTFWKRNEISNYLNRNFVKKSRKK